MAPLSPYSIVTAMHEVKVETRTLDSTNSTSRGPDLSSAQQNTLQYLALAFATISVASAVLAFYWFVRMRRSFRHDLIMLLIQSDMFKALWFMINPIVNFASGPVLSHSKFCQVNGFFVAIGIEASDIAVLMIAIHSALYIFRPRDSAGEGGLYPYRQIAYRIWFFFPIAMASLAFINGSNAYIRQGNYCYLPARPLWCGLALSWVPRYIIFVFILVTYASIYCYVRYKFHGFDKQRMSNGTLEHGSAGNKNKAPKPLKRYSLPPTPVIACHGLVSASRQTSTEGRLQSVSTTELYNLGPPVTTNGTHRFMWENFINNASSSQAPPSELSTLDADSFVGPSTPQPLPQISATWPISPPRGGSVKSSEPSHSRVTSWRDDFVHRLSFNANRTPTEKRSIADIFSVLRRHPGSTEVHTPISQLQLVNSRGQNLAVSEMLRTREKIRRQLRFLFIYPLVYMGMWLIPFVLNVLQYDDKFASNPPFGLICTTTIFVSSQAAVDCWLFSTREKPWRHIPGNGSSFFGSFKFCSGCSGLRKRRKVSGPGKSREEMVREARAAYRRRDDELAQRRTEAENIAQQGDARRIGRSWWEGAGLDGAPAMSPVVEEISNPMEDVVISPNASFPSDSEATLKEETKNSNGSDGAAKSENREHLARTACQKVHIAEGGPLHNI